MNPPKTNHEFRSRRAAAEAALAEAEHHLATMQSLADELRAALELASSDLNAADKRLDLFLRTEPVEAQAFAAATQHRHRTWIRAERAVLLNEIPDHRWLATVEMLNANLSTMCPPMTTAAVVDATARAAYQLLYADHADNTSAMAPGAPATKALEELVARLSAHLRANAQRSSTQQPQGERRADSCRTTVDLAQHASSLGNLKRESLLLAETEAKYLCAVGPYADALAGPLATLRAAVELKLRLTEVDDNDPLSFPSVLATFGRQTLEYAKQMHDLHPPLLTQPPIVAWITITLAKGMTASLCLASGYSNASIQACDDALAERKAALDALPPR